jgi:hypothetical protein
MYLECPSFFMILGDRIKQNTVSDAISCRSLMQDRGGRLSSESELGNSRSEMHVSASCGLEFLTPCVIPFSKLVIGEAVFGRPI